MRKFVGKHLKTLLPYSTLTLGLVFTYPPANAQNSQQPSQQNDDITRRDLANFDRFLDDHRETAQQLRKDPSLIDNHQFLDSHPELQAYLRQHPQVRQEIQDNPNAFMHDENPYDRQEGSRDNDITRRDVANFDRFLDDHRETAEQLRKDPSLIDSHEFLNSHPELQTYLQQHPQVRQEIQDNPNAFMHDENRYDRQEGNRDNESNRRELASFDQFLDSHRETAEQVRKDPTLLNNDQFVKNHPALQTYLQQHPEIGQQVKQNPDAFMQHEASYDRREDSMDRDMLHKPSANFAQFLGSHSNISSDLTKDPSLAKNSEYLANHPELNDYLNSHPDVRQELLANPQSFVASAQQSGTAPKTNPAVKSTTPPTPKP
jgi:hypothetical protein